MLRVGGGPPPSAGPAGPPQPPDAGAGAPPDQMAAASQPDVQGGDPSAGGADHKHELVEALTYMQMAMEKIMNCLQQYQDSGAPDEAPDGDEGADPGAGAPPGGGPSRPPMPGQ
jgi:hypothetical protein